MVFLWLVRTALDDIICLSGGALSHEWDARKQKGVGENCGFKAKHYS
jgi:hypothetical protein